MTVFPDLDPAGSETKSLSSSGMVFPQGLLVGIGPGRITVIRTSSHSLGIWKKTSVENNSTTQEED